MVHHNETTTGKYTSDGYTAKDASHSTMFSHSFRDATTPGEAAPDTLDWINNKAAQLTQTYQENLALSKNRDAQASISSAEPTSYEFKDTNNDMQKINIAELLNLLRELTPKQLEDLQASVTTEYALMQQHRSITMHMHADNMEHHSSLSAAQKSSAATSAFFNTMSSLQQEATQQANLNNTPLVGLLLAWLLANNPEYFFGSSTVANANQPDDSDDELAAAQQKRRQFLLHQQNEHEEEKRKKELAKSSLFFTLLINFYNIYGHLHQLLTVLELKIVKPTNGITVAAVAARSTEA